VHQQPGGDDVHGERRGRGDRGDPVLALALQELVERQDDGVDKVQREHAAAEPGGGLAGAMAPPNISQQKNLVV